MTEEIEPSVLTVERVLNDPSASYWLKNALKHAVARDPIDAASDAEILTILLKNRADKTLQSDNLKGNSN